MKYILVKNAKTDVEKHEYKLTVGEFIYTSSDYAECSARIPLPLDNQKYRLSFCRGEWESILGTIKECIGFFDRFVDKKQRIDGCCDLANLTFNDKDFDILMFGRYLEFKYLNLSLKPFYDHFLYAIRVLTDQPPDNVLDWFEMDSLIQKDLAYKYIVEINYLLDNFGECKKQSNGILNIESIEEELEYWIELSNQSAISEDYIEEYFNECDKYYNCFLDNPNKNGVFGCDYSSEHEYLFKNLEELESYSIFIDFSDPDELFEELKSEIKNGFHKTYWTKDFISNIMSRLVALPDDPRDVSVFERDLDRFYEGIITLLDLSEQEDEWVMEDLLK
jgi:hypothetical protein